MKAELAKVGRSKVNNVTITPKTPVSHNQAFSVSGAWYAFTTVGKAAKPSATILKKIAMLPTLVVNHKVMPTTEKKPHHKSKAVSCHSAFLLTNEAKKIMKGINPALKVMIDSIPTPCE